MEFEYISSFVELIGIIVAAWLLLGLLFTLYLLMRRSALRKLATSSAILRLAPAMSLGKHWLKFLLIMLAVGFLAIGIADPKTGSKIETVEQTGIDLYIALDLSKSMLAQDISPDRLGVAKQFISRLVSGLEGSRIGLVLFAGNAYKQVPLTLNHASALTDLKAADTDFIPKQGTAIGDAVDIAREAFALEFDPEEVNINQSSQVLLLISDGEDHEGDAANAIKLAKEAGITIYTAGIGTEKGGPIPESDKRGNVNYKKDENGDIILTKLNPAMLKDLSESGGGKYFQINSALDADQIVAELQSTDGGNKKEQVFTEHEDQFQWFLLPALILIALEFVINEQSSQLFRKLIGFGGKDA